MGSTHNKEDLEERLERNKFVYEQVNSWIENADNKVSVSCGIFTAVFGVISFLSEGTTAQDHINHGWNLAYRWCFIISLIIMLVSIFFYVLAINPNLGKSGVKRQGATVRKKYPVFYGDIAELTEIEYKQLLNKASEEDFVDELQNEAHYNSGICCKKMCNYKIGLWLSFVAVIFAMLSWLSKVIMYH